MIEHLQNTPCFIIWDKNNTGNFADAELAWTSFDTATRIFKSTWNGMLQHDMKNKEVRIHPTQKPVRLYEWLLINYAKEYLCKECDKGRVLDDDSDGTTITCEYCNGTLKRKPKILDTHLGSGSIAIACHNRGFELTACELDKDYYDAAIKRIKNHTAQTTIFDLGA
jgi:site-specific DNA-methyltransferase (adenine-specific)